MLQTLDMILRSVGIDGITEHFNPDKAVQYTGAKWLGNKQSYYNENCIYIGLASELNDDLPDENIGIIVVNDDSRDLSGYKADLVVLSNDHDPARICLMIKELFFNTYEISAISQSIIEAMLRTYSIREVVDLAADHLNNPVLLSFHYERNSFYGAGDPSITREIAIIQEEYDRSADPEKLEQLNMIWESPQPIIFDDGICYKGKRRMQIPITEGSASNRRIGMLTLFEVRREFTAMDASYLAFMGYIISLKAGQSGFEKSLLLREYEERLHDLIRGASIGPDLSWVDSLFGSHSKHYIVAMADARSISQMTLETIIQRLYQQAVFSTVLMRGSYIVLIANTSDSEYASFFSRLDELADAHQLLFGVSDVFSNILNLQKYYSQAKRIRDIGPMLGASSGVFPFGDYKNGLLIRDLASIEDPDLFVDESVDRLIEHDLREGTSYLETLEAYVRCGMSNERTRRMLHIHRNTLMYRLGRIEEILGHTLEDGDYLIGLFFAASIRRYSAYHASSSIKKS